MRFRWMEILHEIAEQIKKGEYTKGEYTKGYWSKEVVNTYQELYNQYEEELTLDEADQVEQEITLLRKDVEDNE